jgi:anti-anti-sigma factor
VTLSPSPISSAPPDRLVVDVVHLGARSVLSLRGEVDPATAGVLRAAVHDALAAGATEIVLDLGAVAFAGAALLREIVAVRAAGATPTVTAPNSTVRRVLEAAALLDDLACTA